MEKNQIIKVLVLTSYFYFRFGVKAGIVGGSVYYTNELGLWGDSKQSEKAYKEICTFITPYIKDVKVDVSMIWSFTIMRLNLYDATLSLHETAC